MIDLDSRYLILLVAVVVFAGLLAGWAVGIIANGVVEDGIERVGTIGFVSIILFILVVLVAAWFTLEERGDRAD